MFKINELGKQNFNYNQEILLSRNPLKLEDENLFPNERNNDTKFTQCSAVADTPFGQFWGDLVDTLDSDTKDGKIGETKQGQTGDCWLLSGINSISYTNEGKKAIKNALEYKNGYTVVHFQGGAGDYIVTDKEINLTKSSLQYSGGDDDMIILELAFEKLIDDATEGKFVIDENTPFWFKEFAQEEKTSWMDSSAEGGYAGAIMYFLTNKAANYTRNPEKIAEKLKEFSKNNNKDFVIYASTNCEDQYVIDVNTNKKVYLVGSHGYAVKKVSEKENTVTFTNPWNSSKDITVNIDKFTSIMRRIDYCDLSENNQKDANIKINNYSKYEFEKAKNGQEYKIENQYDENGKLIKSIYNVFDSEIGLEFKFNENGEIISSGIGKYDDHEEYKKEYSLSKDVAQNIIDRGLLTYTKFTFDDLIYDNSIASLNDEQWEIAKKYMYIPELKKNQLNADELKNVALLDKNKRDNFIENIKTKKHIDRTNLLNFYHTVSIDSLKDEQYLENIVSGFCKVTDDLPQYFNNMSDTLLQNVIDRNLLTNTRIPKKLSAYDIYVLTHISDEKWDTAVRMLQENPKIDCYDLYKQLQ